MTLNVKVQGHTKDTFFTNVLLYKLSQVIFYNFFIDTSRDTLSDKTKLCGRSSY